MDAQAIPWTGLHLSRLQRRAGCRDVLRSTTTCIRRQDAPAPVSMRTEMPARWHAATAAGTSSRMGSAMPTTASSVRSLSSCSAAEASPLVAVADCGSTSRYARASILHDNTHTST